jgi:poly(3-hydroxybutyrate) depolymerase
MRQESKWPYIACVHGSPGVGFRRKSVVGLPRPPTPPRRLARWLVVYALALLIPTTAAVSVNRAPTIAWPAAIADVGPGRPALTQDGLYLPTVVDATRPVPVLLALHGYAGSGSAIAARLKSCADEHGWLVVAPTMAYRDYFDPDQLRADARDNLPSVHDLLDRVRAASEGFEVADKVLLYGFSRGAQMAHRFSMIYPDRVAAVAALAAGSYTMPRTEDLSQRPMAFPFGVGDLATIADGPFDQEAFGRVPFWVGVGADDTNADETSRAWDQLEGRTRVERATAFATHLYDAGVPVELHVFGSAGHEETGSMRRSACEFLARHQQD